MDFIGAEDSRSPLYGRGREEIILERFSREKSLSFLESGFKEHKTKADPEVLKKVVERLDGIVGWLTLYGSMSVLKKRLNDKELESVLEAAKNMAKDEMQPILRRSKYYKLALKSMSTGKTNWIDIKRDIASWIGRPTTDTQVTRTLETLVKLGTIEKGLEGYTIVDRIVREFAKEL
jgi:AAA+ ATPase superfamily predicted ATPase